MKKVPLQREGFAGQHLIVLPEDVIRQAQAHPLLQNLFVTAAGYFPVAPHHLVERPQGVPEIILIACISGKGWVSFGPGKERIPVHPDEIVVILADQPHAYGSDDAAPWSILWTHFRGQQLADVSRLLATTTAGGAVLSIPPEIRDHMELDQIYKLLEESYAWPNLVSAAARLQLALAEILRSRIPNNPRARSIDEILRQNVDWMKNHCHTQASLGDLARQSGFSIPYYSALFRRKMGSSPMGYFQRMKINYACQLLTLTDLSVEEISHRIGMEDPFYFSRLFKKAMNLSPRSFRNKYKKHSPTKG